MYGVPSTRTSAAHPKHSPCLHVDPYEGEGEEESPSISFLSSISDDIIFISMWW